ncbi:MAG: cation transporter, partial [Deltaproteobacteria bacterium]|nr:cation transporter [Deltaproteobacteria bacterium]
ANGIALVLVSGSIVFEAIERFESPQPVDTALMSAVAAVGLAGNLVGLWLLRGQLKSLNLRGAFLHILGDALSSVGVLAAALIMSATGWTRLDAAVSLGIAVIIVITSVNLLREVVEVLLEAAPTHIDTDSVRATIVTVAGVDDVHDLHVWSITSGMPALSAHVVVRNLACDADTVLSAIQARLRSEYAIDHSTLQIERRPAADCGCE